MSVRKPDALSASLRKHVCSPEDQWNFAEYGSYILQPVPRNPRPRSRLPPILPLPLSHPPIPEGSSRLSEGLLEELTMEYDRETLGHKGSDNTSLSMKHLLLGYAHFTMNEKFNE